MCVHFQCVTLRHSRKIMLRNTSGSSNLFGHDITNSILQEPLSDSSGSGSCVSFESCSNSRISSNVTVSCVLFSVRTITAWCSIGTPFLLLFTYLPILIEKLVVIWYNIVGTV